MALVLFAPVLVERWLVLTPPEPPPLAITLDLLHVALMPEPPDPPGSLLVPDLPSPLCRVLISIVDVVPLSLSSSTIYTFLGLVVVSFGGILGMLMSLPYVVCSFRIYMPLRVKSQLLSLQCCTADLGMLLLDSLKSLSSNSSLERPPPPPPFYRAILIVSLGPSVWQPNLQPPLINFFPPGDSLKPDLVSLRFYIAIHPSLRFSYRIRLPPPKISVSLPKYRYTSGEECFWAVHQLLSRLLSSMAFPISSPSPSSTYLDVFLDWFIGIVRIYSEVVMSSLAISFLWKRLLQTFFCLRGELIPSLMPGKTMNVFVYVLSCVVVRMGPEETNGIALVNFEGKTSASTSLYVINPTVAALPGRSHRRLRV